MTCKGTVKGNVVLLDEGVSLPEGARVEVRVIGMSNEARVVIDRIRARREQMGGVKVGLKELLEESKRELEER